MAVSLKHSFTSPKTDGTDSTLVQPSNWNAEHTLTLGTGKLLGRTTAGTGAAEEISAGSGLTLSGGSLSAAVTSVAGRTGAVTIAVADVSGAAPTASPTFTGTITGAAATLSGALSGTTGTFSGNVNTTSGVYQVNSKQAVNGPAFHAYLNAAQTVTANTITKIALNAELFDTDSCFDATTNHRFTPTVEGYYYFDGLVCNGGQVAVFCQLYKNGSAVIYGTRVDLTGAGYGLAYASAVSGLLYMNGSTDYVELYGQTSGTAFQGNTSGALVSRLSGFMARGA